MGIFGSNSHMGQEQTTFTVIDSAITTDPMRFPNECEALRYLVPIGGGSERPLCQPEYAPVVGWWSSGELLIKPASPDPKEEERYWASVGGKEEEVVTMTVVDTAPPPPSGDIYLPVWEAKERDPLDVPEYAPPAPTLSPTAKSAVGPGITTTTSDDAPVAGDGIPWGTVALIALSGGLLWFLIGGKEEKR